MKKTFFGKKKVRLYPDLAVVKRYCAVCGRETDTKPDPYVYRFCPYCGAETSREWEEAYDAYVAGREGKDVLDPGGWAWVHNMEEEND